MEATAPLTRLPAWLLTSARAEAFRLTRCFVPIGNSLGIFGNLQIPPTAIDQQADAPVVPTDDDIGAVGTPIGRPCVRANLLDQNIPLGHQPDNIDTAAADKTMVIGSDLTIFVIRAPGTAPFQRRARS